MLTQRTGAPLLASLLLVLVSVIACSSEEASTDATATFQQPTPTVTAESGRPLSELSDQEKIDLNLALIDAAWQNDVDEATALIDSGADVNFNDATKQSAYLIATSEGYDELLELTFLHGADVTSLDSFNGTGLIRSAERGHANVVGRLLQADVDVDHVNRLGWTALHEAIILGTGAERYIDTVRVLVAGGADLVLPSASDNISPLEHAESRDQTVVVTTLRKALEAASVDDADAAVLAAADDGDADRLALALRAGGNIEARDSALRTPLLLAVTGDHLEAARLLVALGADADALDGQHDTPWLVTGVTGSVAMAEVLLAGFPEPDLTILNRFGGTALIPAADRGHVDYVRRVVGTDVDIDHVNDLGWTALLEAVILGDGSQRYQEIVTILLEAGADSSIGDRGRVTAREHAERAGYEAIAKILSGE